MKTTAFLCRVTLATLPLLLPAIAGAEVLIDSFVTPQSAPGGGHTTNVADGIGIIGGEHENFGLVDAGRAQ